MAAAKSRRKASSKPRSRSDVLFVNGASVELKNWLFDKADREQRSMGKTVLVILEEARQREERA